MATTCVVTATITDPSQTSLLGNAFVKFRLRNFLGFVPQVSGTNVVCEDTIVAYPSPAGFISQTLVCNTAISPVNTFYTAEFWNQGRIVSSANYYFNANTSLNTASNINPAPAPTGASSIVFENNSVLNSSQTVLNVTSTQLSITDLGGGQIDIEPGSGASGANLTYIPPFSGGAGNLAGYTLCLRVPSSMVLAAGNSLQVGLSFYNVNGINGIVSTAAVAATPPNPYPSVSGFAYQTNWTEGPVGITWPAGSFTTTSEIYLSNPATITVDPKHDYYVMVYLAATNTAYSPYLPTGSGAGIAWTGLANYISGNSTAATNASSLIGNLSSPGYLLIPQVVVG